MIRREDLSLKFTARTPLPPGRSISLKDRVKWMISRIHSGRFRGDLNMSTITGAQAEHIQKLATDWVKAQLEADRLRQSTIGPWVREPCPLIDKTGKVHPIVHAIENEYSVQACFNDFVLRGRKPYGMKFYDTQVFENFFEHYYRENHMEVEPSDSNRGKLSGQQAKPQLKSKSKPKVKSEDSNKDDVDMVTWAELRSHKNLLSGTLSFLVPWLALTFKGKYSPNSCVTWAKKSAALIILAYLYIQKTTGHPPCFTQDEVEALLRPTGVSQKFCLKNKALMALALCNETRLTSFCTQTNAEVCLQNSKEETKFKNDAQEALGNQGDALKSGKAYLLFKKALASFKVAN